MAGAIDSPPPPPAAALHATDASGASPWASGSETLCLMARAPATHAGCAGRPVTVQAASPLQPVRHQHPGAGAPLASPSSKAACQHAPRVRRPTHALLHACGPSGMGCRPRACNACSNRMGRAHGPKILTVSPAIKTIKILTARPPLPAALQIRDQMRAAAASIGITWGRRGFFQGEPNGDVNRCSLLRQLTSQ